MWLTFALRYWKWIALAALLIGAGLWIRSYGNERCHACRAAVIAEYQAKLAEANERTRVAEARADEVSMAKDAEWQEERNALQNRVTDLLARPQPIRLCKQSPGRGGVPALPGSTVEPAGTAADAGSTLQAGADIGPELVRYGGDCERYRAQLSALQQWVTAQATLAR